MPILHHKTLLAFLVAILFAAVLGQAVAQQAEAVFKTCSTEHQDGEQDEDSHCPCVCHHHQTAVMEWQTSIPGPFRTVSIVVDQPQSITEAPPASIEYPPQLV